MLVALALLTVSVGIVLTGCANQMHAQKQELDDAIHEVERVLGRYAMADPQGPVAELHRTTDRVVAAWDGVRSAAEGLEEFDLTEAEEALAELVRASEELSDDLTAREGLALIEPQIDTFEEAVDEIHDALGVH